MAFNRIELRGIDRVTEFVDALQINANLVLLNLVNLYKRFIINP
ncbi:hypothetical protein Glo7428_4096 [Gloeocapsa sp. PCC 7428]|nr:hypothetical protein [Gloeocapsa sp. PCC 7428]AFZ32546.1 hypothetical protein Glo7428_4096 [Gloeocapsa sp. PCC 7428]